MAYIVIDEKKCKSCYLCIDACPRDLIEISEKTGITGNFTVKFNKEKGACTGCKSCAISCPDLAITEVYR